MDDTEGKLRDMLVDLHGFDRDRITRNATFDEDLGADSLDMSEILMDTEVVFDTELPEGAVKSRTVGDLVVAIDRAVRAN